MTERDRVEHVDDVEAVDGVEPDTGPAEAAGEQPAAPLAERPAEPIEIHVVEGGLDAEAEAAPEDDGADLLAAAEAAVTSDINRVISERDDYLDALRHLQADFENYKKRVLKQQTEHLERAAEELVLKLLPVLDTGELAKAHGGGDAVVQITGMLFETLAKEGLEDVEASPGTVFDPTVHDAVAHEDGDSGDVTVSELLRAGYRWKGRLIRPAMVKVKG